MSIPDLTLFRTEPLVFAKILWPGVYFYKDQREIIESVVWNKESYVAAAHKMGKDYVAGFLCLWYFLCHHPVRVVTTSVKDSHLMVLWGEIARFIETAKYPLTAKKGGPLSVNHREIRKVINGEVDKYSYLIGCVSERGEGLAGHHAPNTLLVCDEASGCDDEVMIKGDTWAKRLLIFGNTYDPRGGTNFFKRAVMAGDVVDDGD
jgi:hypothetical protein